MNSEEDDTIHSQLPSLHGLTYLECDLAPQETRSSKIVVPATPSDDESLTETYNVEQTTLPERIDSDNVCIRGSSRINEGEPQALNDMNRSRNGTGNACDGVEVPGVSEQPTAPPKESCQQLLEISAKTRQYDARNIPIGTKNSNCSAVRIFVEFCVAHILSNKKQLSEWTDLARNYSTSPQTSHKNEVLFLKTLLAGDSNLGTSVTSIQEKHLICFVSEFACC